MKSLHLAGRVIITILVSIVIPLATGLLQDRNGISLLTPFEQFTIGAIVFVSLSLTTIGYDLSKLLALKTKDRRELDQREESGERGTVDDLFGQPQLPNSISSQSCNRSDR